jgi:S1-C subfamily serine protease
MRMCEPELSLDNVWHVLDVLEGSPAESAGLVPYGDWIIGWSGGVLSGEGDFYDVVEAVSYSKIPLIIANGTLLGL